MSKWSKSYWADLGERAGSTAGYGVITMLTADASGAVSGSPKQWWVIVGLPTALSVLKGLLANLKDAESGASLLPAPPGPVVDPEAAPEGVEAPVYEEGDVPDDPEAETDPLARPYHSPS